jgi:hypothetical protein
MHQKYNNSQIKKAKGTFKPAQKNEFGNWLSNENWTHYATFTTGYELTLNSARRAMHRIHDNLDKMMPCTMFWAAEPFDVKTGYHTHALISTHEHLSYKALHEMWQKVCGNGRKGNQRLDISKFDPQRNAGYYLSKYITKRLSDYDYLTPGASANYRQERFRRF